MRRLPRILLLTVFIPLAVALTVVLSLQVQAQSPTVYRVFLPATVGTVSRSTPGIV